MTADPFEAVLERLQAAAEAYNAGDDYGKTFIPGLSRAVEIVQRIMLERQEAGTAATSTPAETVTEWAVRLVDGEILERPNQRAALNAALGSSEVVSRQVTRTRWQPMCKRCHGHGYVPDFSNGLNEYGEPGKKPCPTCQSDDQQRAEDTIRAVHLGRRAPAGRLLYLANRLEAALNDGTITPTVLATINVLRTTAAEMEGEQP